MKKFGIRGFHTTFLLLLTVLFSVPCPVVSATTGNTFTVDDLSDLGDGNIGDGVCSVTAAGSGPCTLRAALEEANYFSDADTINFDSALFTSPPVSIILTSGLSIYVDVTITGPGSDKLIIDGQNNYTVFDASYSGLTVGNRETDDFQGGRPAAEAGAE